MAEIKHVQEPVTNYAKSKGWLVRRMAYLGRRGCADSWFFKDGRLIIIEFKELGEEPNLIQSREHKRFTDRGFHIHVIDNADDGYALFD